MPDKLEVAYPKTIKHEALFSGGGMRTVIKTPKDPATKALVQVEQSGKKRDMAWVRSNPQWNGGKVVYLRGTNSSSFTGGRLLTPHDPEKYFQVPQYLRYVLQEFGICCLADKHSPELKPPVLTISRSNNAFIFSGYNPNNTVKLRFKMPQGAPLLLGLETKLENGNSTYVMPTAWNRECRIFVEQYDGIVSCKELHSGQVGISKRFQVTGLKNAKVRIYPGDDVTASLFHAYANAGYPWKTGRVSFKAGDEKLGAHFVVENVKGSLVVAW